MLGPSVSGSPFGRLFGLGAYCATLAISHKAWTLNMPPGHACRERDKSEEGAADYACSSILRGHFRFKDVKSYQQTPGYRRIRSITHFALTHPLPEALNPFARMNHPGGDPTGKPLETSAVLGDRACMCLVARRILGECPAFELLSGTCKEHLELLVQGLNLRTCIKGRAATRHQLR
jgi:hypothetical protein